MTRLRRLRLLSTAVAGAAWLAACQTQPGQGTAPAQPVKPASTEAAPPSAPPPSAPEPAGPASQSQQQQAQRLALVATELLEVGNEEQALGEIQRALQADSGNRLAQSLLKQIQTDPQTLLGREFFNYRVEPGESLSRIAGRFLKDVHLFYALARYNDIKVPRQLQGGQMIKVPGKQPVTSPAPAPAPAPAPVPVAPPPPAPAPVAPAPAPAASKVPEPAVSVDALVQQEYRRGLSLMAQQKPAEAIQAFDRVLDRNPNHANAKLKRAQAVTQVGGLIRLLENTIKRLDAQLAQNPNNAAARAERDKAVADRDRLLQVK